MSRDFLVGDVGFDEHINSIQKYELDMVAQKYHLDKLKNENENNKAIDKSNLSNLSMADIYDKMVNIVPNLYKDYYKEYLNVSTLKHKNEHEHIKVRESLINTFLNSKNMIYVGIWFIITALLLYILDI
jgi:hypothetical protein